MPIANESYALASAILIFKVIIAMAISGYCYNPMSDRNDAISSIKDDLEKNGVALDANTIRKWLKIAVESVLPGKDA